MSLKVEDKSAWALSIRVKSPLSQGFVLSELNFGRCALNNYIFRWIKVYPRKKLLVGLISTFP
jgi:hypothetical protein